MIIPTPYNFDKVPMIYRGNGTSDANVEFLDEYLNIISRHDSIYKLKQCAYINSSQGWDLNPCIL